MARKRKYIKTGICIWCGKKEPEVTFKNKPHIVPDAVGGNQLSFDVCDECNRSFGSQPNCNIPSPDQIFCEIFNLQRFCGGDYIKNGEKHRTNYIKLKDNILQIPIVPIFSDTVGTQLKRAFYEIFLQKYHAFTEDGNNPKFNPIVSFARYNANVCDLKVYYVKEQMWFVPCTQEKTFIPMSKKMIQEMNDSGFFNFNFLGYNFFIEVFKEKCNKSRDSYFRSQLSKLTIPGRCITEFNNISQLDEIFKYLNVEKIEYI